MRRLQAAYCPHRTLRSLGLRVSASGVAGSILVMVQATSNLTQMSFFFTHAKTRPDSIVSDCVSLRSSGNKQSKNEKEAQASRPDFLKITKAAVHFRTALIKGPPEQKPLRIQQSQKSKVREGRTPARGTGHDRAGGRNDPLAAPCRRAVPAVGSGRAGSDSFWTDTHLFAA